MISTLKKQQRNGKGAVWNGRRAVKARGRRKGSVYTGKQGGQGYRRIMSCVIFLFIMFRRKCLKMDLIVKSVDRCHAEHCVPTAVWLQTQETG
jgi:hypothetical protein